jgi:hypothetical protein
MNLPAEGGRVRAVLLLLSFVLAAPDAPMLLVLPLKSEPQLASTARALDEMLLKSLHDTKRYQVVGQEDLNALLGVEKMKDAAGCDDVACAAEIGGALGAPWLLAGSLNRLGEQAVLSLRLVDTKKAVVTGRASARGATTGDGLEKLLATAVGEVFGASAVTPTSAPAAAGDYGAFTEMMTGLGRRMSNSEYTQMLTDLDRYATMKVTSPPGTDAGEMLVYYRVIACAMLKRTDCVQKSAAEYRARWPSGTYSAAVQTYVDQIADAAAERADAAEELERRLAEIADQNKRGSVDAAQADELVAYAYFSAKEWQKAAGLFEALVRQQQKVPDKLMQLAQALCIAAEQIGDFERCRVVLTKAEQDYPKEFRKAGLQHTLRRLPK